MHGGMCAHNSYCRDLSSALCAHACFLCVEAHCLTYGGMAWLSGLLLGYDCEGCGV